MNKKELMQALDISQATLYRLLKEGMPAENHKRTIFELDRVIEWRNARDNSKIDSLIIGKEYANEEIAEAFKCSTQGGMRRSHTSNSLVLFTDHTGKNIYEDEWVNNILHYTGMGLEGNQTIETNQNKILANSNTNRVKVFLFETFSKSKHTFAGQVKLVEEPYTVSEKDKNGSKRLVYKFPIKIMDSAFLPDERKVVEVEEKLEKQVRKLSDKELEEKAKDVSERNKAFNQLNKGNNKNNQTFRYIQKKEFIRNVYISEYIKELAKGICQLCEQPAPFEKDGKPYLHSHHIQYLANGGLDSIENCIAVCPNCHAKIHEIEDPADCQKLLDKITARK